MKERGKLGQRQAGNEKEGNKILKRSGEKKRGPRSVSKRREGSEKTVSGGGWGQKNKKGKRVKGGKNLWKLDGKTKKNSG